MRLLTPVWLCLAVLLFLQPTKASPVTFQLAQGNSAVTGCPGCTGPFGSVTVNQTSATTATITFTGASQGSNTYLFGAQGIVGLNFNAATVTVTSPLGPDLSLGGANNEDGFGLFNFTLDNFDGFSHAVSSLTFNVSCTGCNWSANSSNVLTPNAGGFSVAAHIFAVSGGVVLATGYAADGPSGPPPPPPPGVPEPASMLLLGTGLVSLAGYVRKRRR